MEKDKSKRKTEKSILNIDDFYSYFKEIYDVTIGDVDSCVHNDSVNNDLIFDEMLDVEITIEEVRAAIKKLKRNKSPGIDGIIGEMFIYGEDILSPILAKFFNIIFENGIFPSNWTHGIIVPLPKRQYKRY